MRMTNVTAVQTYMQSGLSAFAVGDITGATALTAQPASDDEIVINDGGTLKRLDLTHIYNLPAIHVWFNGSQTIAAATATKLILDTEVLDTNSTFDSSTEYRWTPGVAGWYWLAASCRRNATGDDDSFLVAIRRNGATSTGNRIAGNGVVRYANNVNCSGPMFLDADDYVEVYVQTASERSLAVGAGVSFLAGFRIAGLPTS
tara:strand:- start:326 stop:931 length:606 start_codon:yes stop_codon:yes gene_type:complete